MSFVECGFLHEVQRRDGAAMERDTCSARWSAQNDLTLNPRDGS